VTLETFAALAAALKHFGAAHRAEVLARKGVDERTFTTEESRWTQAIVETSSNEDNSLVEAFGLAFSAEQRRLRRDGPPLSSLGHLPDPPLAPPSVVAVTRPAASPPEGPPREEPRLVAPPVVPTYLLADPPEGSVDETVMGGVPNPLALPFSGKLGAPPPAKPVSRSPDAGGTVIAPLPEAVRTMLAQPEAFDPDVTQKPFRNPLPIIPFAGRTTPERIREIAGPPTTEPADDAGATVLAPLPDLGSEPREARPDMSLRDYATLRAALSAEGEDNAGVLARFGLTTAAKQALQEAYFELFRTEPALRLRFETLLREELRKLGRGGT